MTVTADKQSYEHKSKGSVFGSACVKRPLVEESERAFKSVCLSATVWLEISGETTLSYTTCFLLGIPTFLFYPPTPILSSFVHLSVLLLIDTLKYLFLTSCLSIF